MADGSCHGGNLPERMALAHGLLHVAVDLPEGPL